MAPEIQGSSSSSGATAVGSGFSPLAYAGLNAASNLASSLVSNLFNRSNMKKQVQYSKELMDYQWKNFNSPSAILNSLKDVGLGVNAMVEGKGSMAASPTGGMPSSAPIQLDGLYDLSAISAYIQSVANAKKAGMDTKLSEQEIKNKEVERQRNEFELSLRKQFGKDINTAELANAYMQVVLAADQSDINEQLKAINEYKKASEKAVADANESQASILRQNLENNPTVIKLENSLREEKIKSEKAGQAASYASAEASHASAEFIRSQKQEQDFFNEVRASDGVKESFVTQMKEFGKQALREGWLTHWQVKAAEYAASQAAYADDMKQYTYWINQICNIVGSAASIGGVGVALKHFSKLDATLGSPKTSTTESYNAFGEKTGHTVTTSNR